MNDFFCEGPIHPDFIRDSIQHHQQRHTLGAHEFFLGQVRRDTLHDKAVQYIDYTAHKKMANTIFQAIKEKVLAEFPVECVHIRHSLGKVAAGELCLFVMVSSAHRLAARQALEQCVEEIKARVPVFGREVLEDQSHSWKVNT